LNRHSFSRELESHAARVNRYGPEGALLMLDLDHFKYVNDTLGHQAGDEIIVRAAELLAGRLRESDVLARLGGDEFAILLPRGNAESARELAARNAHAAALVGYSEFRPRSRKSGSACSRNPSSITRPDT
jgi:diguanylate cyclase (GGDEF)-like protein